MNRPLPRSNFGKKFEENWDRVFGEKTPKKPKCTICEDTGIIPLAFGGFSKCRACDAYASRTKPTKE